MHFLRARQILFLSAGARHRGAYGVVRGNQSHRVNSVPPWPGFGPSRHRLEPVVVAQSTPLKHVGRTSVGPPGKSTSEDVWIYAALANRSAESSTSIS